jgi:hypothetical protein
MSKIDLLVVLALIAGIAAAFAGRSQTVSIPLVIPTGASPSPSETAIHKPQLKKNDFSLAELSLGMGLSDVLDIKGMPQSESSSGNALLWEWTSENPAGHLRITFLDGLVVSMQSEGPESFRRAKKDLPGYGSSSSEIVAALGKPSQQEPDLLLYDHRPGASIFHLKNDKVQSITLVDNTPNWR